MIKKFSNKLPTILQTDTQKEFFSATFDQLFSSAEVEQAQGFIGRRSSNVFQPGVDNYLQEPTKLRAAYQLEPIAFAVNAALQDTNEVFYEDLINYIDFRGGNVSNHDRLFGDNFYSFAPPIDVDKYLNYQNYLWLEDGGPTIFIQYAGSGGAAAFDTIIRDEILGSLQYNTSQNEDLRPRGLQLSSGMRVRFEGSASYDRSLFIEGVGRQIRLVEELTTLQPGSSVTNILWDNNIVFDVPSGTGYVINMTSVDTLVNAGRDYTASDVLTVVHPDANGETTAATITVDTLTAATELSTIDAQDETDFDGAGSNGTFAPGADYQVGDVITLNDGSQVTVDTIDGSGAILTFDITVPSVTSFTTGSTLTQASTSRTGFGSPNPEGTGFTLTTNTNNETPINAIATFSLTTAGDYLFAPPATVSVTGGTGTNAVFEVTIEGELQTVVGGTFTTAATLRPLEVDATGQVLTATIVDRGAYTVFPVVPASTTSAGSGTGLQITFVLDGDAGELFDNTFFDANVNTDLSDSDYLTIERGSCEGSPWARTNRWFNVDIINTAQSLGQIIDATIVDGGINYTVGDQLPVDGDGINGIITVTSVDGSGTITGIRVNGRGQGYTFGGVDQTGAAGTTDTVLWDATDTVPDPDGALWDVSFDWDEVLSAGGGQNAIIDITLASAVDRSTRALRPILEYRRDLQLRDFGNQFLIEVQVVADTELFGDVEGQPPGTVVDGVELRDGMRLIFLDPSQIPNFFQWDESPSSGNPGNSFWDTVGWEAEGASGAVSRFIWEVDLSGPQITLLKVDPFTGLADPNATVVPEGGVVLATLGNDYAGDSFYQFRNPLTGQFTWREGQIRTEANTPPLFELFDINGVQLDDPIEYPDSDFSGNEIFSYRVLEAADIADEGGTLTSDPVLGFPLTLTGLRQISDIVFENDLETNRVTHSDGEIPGYYFYKIWDVDAECNINTDPLDTSILLSEFRTNWLASNEPERQRVIDRFLTTTDTEDSFELSAEPRTDNVSFDIRVNEGRRLNTDEFAFIRSTGRIQLFEKPVDSGFITADGTDSLYAFVGINDPAEVFVNNVYQERGLNYNVIESVQLDEVSVPPGAGGAGYAVDDLLTVVGGTTTQPAQVRVVSVDGLGAVTGVFITSRGVYAQPPSSPFAVSGGSGVGASIAGIFVDATANTFTLQFIDENGNPEVQAINSFIEVREQGSGAPGANTIIDVSYSTFDAITDADIGFFEIPNGLENNPNNLEILEQSWNQFAPHMVSIIENQDSYLGNAFGSINNYRDTAKDGSEGNFILQTQSPLLKTMLATSNNELDIIEALRFNSKEYARYKNKFLKVSKELIDQGFTPFEDGDTIPIDQWVDEAIRRIIRSREYANAFEDTYMLAYGTVFEEETSNFVSTVGTRTITQVSEFVDLNDKKNALYVYVNEKLQVIDVDYTFSNTNPIEIEWINIPTGSFVITVRLYENIAPSHIPATAQKLGLAPIFQPLVMRDDSYQAPLDVIVGHDGSKTPLFGDFRDDLLLEFETRIYNGILEQFRVEYTPPLEEDNYKPGKYRNTRWSTVEWNALLRPSFFKWVAAERADYITNEFYDVNNPFTWNYSTVIDPNSNDTLPGYWRGIFDFYYDTQTPATTPWEMLGFNSQPLWWEDEYGPAPYTSLNPLWNDIEEGRIRQGYRAGIDTRYARPGLTTNSIPVDITGSAYTDPLLAIANDGSLLPPNSVDAAAGWQYGDLAPVEYAWRVGEQYQFAVSEAMFLARPGEYGEKFWDPEHTFFVPAEPLQIVTDNNNVFKRVGNDTLTVHGETIGGVKQVNTGWQVWVSGRLRALGKDLGNDFGQLVRTLDVKLGHKMASFTNEDTLSVFVEGISVESQANNLLIPQENITVSLHTGSPVREYVYGGVLIRAQANGSYQIFGYDILEGAFNYIPRKNSAADTNVNVGGQPEQFTAWVSSTQYSVGNIVRFNTIFYRAAVANSDVTFDPNKWQKLSQLPTVGGINVTLKPAGTGVTEQIQYGTQLDSIQDVFDVIIGYGEWLESEGWVFENRNPETTELETWLTAAKQFLLWVNTNWEANSIIMISPAATGATLVTQEGYPAAVEKITNGVYSILDKNGVVIDARNTIVNRDNRTISIRPAIEQVGIYGVRINTTETESILTFDNVTQFNDTIYDPLLGSRLARLTFNGRRTTNWTGKLEAGGYIITESGLIPNFENLVDSIRFYHDTETILDNPNIENAARHLIGFEEREYFEDLQILDDAQFQFFQGAIRQKGTVQSLRRLERSTLVGDATQDTQVFEEWALRVGKSGNICGNQTVEFLLAANEVNVDPQLVQLDYPRSNIAGDKQYFTNDDIVGNNVTISNHNLLDGDLILYNIPPGETGTIAELTSGDLYRVIVINDNDFSIATLQAPTVALPLTTAGPGTAQYSIQAPINGSVSSIDIVSKSNVYILPPSITIENNPDDTQGTGATAIAILNSDGTLARIDVTNPGLGYILPPIIFIGDTITDVTDDRAVANIQFTIADDTQNDDIILIDVDDNVRWPTKPEGIACSINTDLWPTTVERVTYTLPNAGNVSTNDTNFTYVSTEGLDALALDATSPTRKGETIHVAYGENESFATYLLNNLRLTTPNLLIDSQLTESNAVYSEGRVILNTNLSDIGEDSVLQNASLTVDTNGSGQVSNITVQNSGYGYWNSGTITVSSAAGIAGNNDAIFAYTNIDGVFTLNVPQQTIVGQTDANFDGIGNEGVFTAGSGYVNTEVITLSDGSTVEVNNNVGGVITQFTITANSATPFNTIGTLTQSGTTGIGTGFTLTLGGANAELVTPIGSGYTVSQTNIAIAATDIPTAAQSGRYLSNIAEGGAGKLYVNSILYDYAFTGWDTGTTLVSVNRGTGYTVGDELNVNGGVSTLSPALITVDNVRTITGQTRADFSGVAPAGSVVGGVNYAASRQTFDSADVDTAADEIVITAHGFVTGDAVAFKEDTTAPSGLITETVYYIIRVDANTIQLATTQANASAGNAIDLTSAGVGTAHVLGDTIFLEDGSLLKVDELFARLFVSQDETDFNGAGSNGTFTGGLGYAASDTITLSDDAIITVDAINATTFSSIVGQDELEFGGVSPEGSFTTGTDYDLGDTIVLNDGTQILVDAVSGTNISEFTITGASTSGFASGATLTQSSTSGGGTGFTLTMDTANEAPFGDIVQFTITTSGQTIDQDLSVLTQSSTTGNGTNFSLTLGENNLDTSQGVVREFTIVTSGNALLENGATLRQATTTENGVGFELSLGPANEEIFQSTLRTGGAYTTNPTSPVTVNGGTGTGATFTLDGFSPLYDITKDDSPVVDNTFVDDSEFFILSNIRYSTENQRDNFVDEDFAAGVRTVWIDDNGTGLWEVQNVTAPTINTQTEADYDGTWTIASGDHGTFTPGENYNAADTITLSDGSIVTVGSVDTDDNIVATFTFTTPPTSNVQIGDTITQVSTSGSGVGFSLTVDSHNLDITSVAYTQRDIQDTLIETENFKNAFVYEQSTGDTIIQLPVYDPFKGLIPGPANLNLTWTTRNDPARYNNAASNKLSLISDTNLFGAEQVGRLWWDTSTMAYLYYELGSDTYRRDNWGKLINGSSIDVYEWTRSSQPPANYTGDGTVRSITEFVQTREFDRTLEEVRTFYYFWVQNRTIVPDGVERTIAAFEVARLLSNPAGQRFQWFSPVSQNAFMFSGIDGVFTDSDNILQINYRRTEDEETKHVEWQLGRENDPDYDILDIHWNKMVDSLSGFTDLVPINTHTNTDIIATFLTDSTGIDNGTEVITTTSAHGFSTGDGVVYSKNNGVEDIGLSQGVMYYVNSIDSTSLSLHITRTDAVSDANRIDLTTSNNEEHSLTAETIILNNYTNAIPSAADSTMGYLIVPDPDLSESQRLGIKTRPLQSMFKSITGARRIFVDKVNELMFSVNLRDENPTWNASLSTNDLWEYVDWFAPGFDAETAVPTFQVSSVNDLQNITQIIDEDIVRVTGTRFRLFQYNADTDSFTLIGREASRLRLLPTIYTADLSLATAIELRELITALRNNVFVGNRFVFSNRIFFTLLNYVFTEQEDLDWAFKTTYLFLKQQGRTLRQDRVFQNDPFDSALEYFVEIKPYQSKIRDFRIERSTEIDLVPGTAEELTRNFNIDMVYDRIRGGDLSVTEMRIAKIEAAQNNRWDGYTTRDGGQTLIRLGAAGRMVASQRDLLTDIADVDSDILEAYSTDPVVTSLTFDTNGLGQVVNPQIVVAGQGYYTSGTISITDASLDGNDNAVISYTVDVINAKGSIISVGMANQGNGYTPNQVGVTVAALDLPLLTSAEITDEELAAVAEINTRITNEFASDFEGLFLPNTEFTGNPTLISANISSAGTGYVLGDILSLDAGSGVPITNAQFRVAGVSGGAIIELQLINGGSYQQTPTVDPVNLLGGTGTGASVTNLLFESGSGVPYDSTPHDQIGWDSSVFDPNVDALEGTPLDLYRTIVGQTQVDFDSGTNEGSFVAGTGYIATEILTLNDGTNIEVDNVSGGGIITEFTIIGGSTTSNASEATLTQTGSTGAGTGFILTLGLANQSSANFFDVPPEETFSGNGTQKEFILTTITPTVFMFVVVDGIELSLNVDYFFIADRLVFITAPSLGTNNIQVFTYIEAGDLINPQAAAGITEEMIPLDPRENLVFRVDTVDVALNAGGSGYSGSEVLTVQGGTLKAGGSAMTITVDSVTGDAVNTFTVTTQGDYDIYPSNPVAIIGTGGNDDATFDITSVSFTIHEDTQQGVNYYRNTDAASTRLTSNANPDDISISIADDAPLDPQPDWDNPALAWIGTELIQYHDVRVTRTVDSIVINNAGTGYVAGDILTVEGNTTGPTSNAVITVDTVGGGGDITSATLTINGSYKEDPGSTAVAVTAGSILNQDETDFDNTGDNGTFTIGSGYAASDTITLDDGTVVTVDAVDIEAQIDFGTDGAGTVNDVSIVDGGQGYTTGGNFNITIASDAGFSGTPAIITYTVAGGSIDSVVITNAGSGYTTSLPNTTDINAADIPDPSAGSISQFTITTVTSSASETDPGSALITLNQVSTSGGGSGFVLVLNIDNQSGDENATFDLTTSSTGATLLGVRRGYRGTYRHTHTANDKIFSAADAQLITNPEVHWIESTTVNQYNGTAGQWRFVGLEDFGSGTFRSVIHFSDTTDNAFDANVSDGDVLDITHVDVGGRYAVLDIIQTGELGIITITAPGTGYQIGDIIDIDSVATGGTGAVAEVGAVDISGGIVYVRIVSRGSGYTDIGAVAVTNSEITTVNGTGATLNAFFDEEGIVAALPNRILDSNGIVAEVNGLTWQTDSRGTGLADSTGNTGAVAAFLQASPGNAI